jgi:hypothetical protein
LNLVSKKKLPEPDDLIMPGTKMTNMYWGSQKLPATKQVQLGDTSGLELIGQVLPQITLTSMTLRQVQP